MEIPCHQIHHGRYNKPRLRQNFFLKKELYYFWVWNVAIFYEIVFKEPKQMMVDSGVEFYRVRVRLKELRWLYGITY